MNPILVLLILFLVTLFLGVPFAWSLSFSCICTLCFMSGFPLMTAVQKMYNGGAKYTLLAIFFFMLAGAIMQHGGISSRLVDFSKALLGHVRGGLSIVVLAVCMMFAALSGSSIATTAAIGGMLYPELVKEKYPEGYSAALPVAGGTLGIVIPPSIVFVVYGATTGTSVSKLLMSGVIPGVMAGVFMIIYAWFYAKKHNIPRSNEFSWRSLGLSTKKAIWSLLMPVIILGGIYSGLFTPTESAAVAVVYGLFVAAFIHHEMTPEKLVQITIDAVKGTANILMLIMAATLFGYVLTIYQVPALLTDLMSSFITGKYSFLLFLNIMLIFLGMLMDSGATILIIAPLVYEMAVGFGIDPVQLGCIIVFNLAVGQATPPFGNCLFAAIPATRQDIITIAKNVLPFVVILFATVFLISYVPIFSMLLPGMMK
ncbi:TRAP transporter large permease [Otoolea muris]|uniref:TRAP transporter large permease n=1 Tax=Otoolea muris TaxID=2941515 RepID=UPI00203F77A5|nr:TRAP transporter large permease [Otoolea muris]